MAAYIPDKTLEFWLEENVLFKMKTQQARYGTSAAAYKLMETQSERAFPVHPFFTTIQSHLHEAFFFILREEMLAMVSTDQKKLSKIESELEERRQQLWKTQEELENKRAEATGLR